MSNLPLTIPDLVCVDDLDPFAGETTSDLQTLIQDVYHLLLEIPGSNPDDPDRGIGASTYLSGTLENFKSLPGRIETQLGTDDRISSVSCTITPQASDNTFTVNLNIGVGTQVIPLQFGWQSGVFTNQTP